jgi:putative FmdB family regulatory protein
MPTYEYRCKECGHEFETVQSFTDAALTECPACHGALRKVFGAVGISFKGSGFYKNDHGARAKASTNGSSDHGDSKKGESKSDSSSSGDAAKSDTSSSSAKEKKESKKESTAA